MIQELTLVWLSSASLSAHQPELHAWSRAHQVVLRPAMTAASPAYDPAVAEAIEVELDRARTALAMRQGDAPALASVCQQIVQHPELPQAAWLLAECHRLSASLSAQGVDAVTAAQRQQAAHALEGPRAPAYSADPIALAPLEPLAVVEIETVGPRVGDQVFLDGESIAVRALTSVGTHHVRVVRDEAVLWSGWLDVAAQSGQLRVPLSVPPCSTHELSEIVFTGSQVTVPQDVRCPNWLIARPQADGTGIDVWQCQANRCSGPRQWPVPQRQTHEATTGTAWYVWPLVGVGVALGTAAVLWQTGAFDRDTPQTERPFTFTFDDSEAAAIRF
ncbi:MAG TPA: hypothetical protein VHO25_00505 [Polyangiaceae bacterium]|nr:hypothetical protein [Polyangiaceae bacterium]